MILPQITHLLLHRIYLAFELELELELEFESLACARDLRFASI